MPSANRAQQVRGFNKLLNQLEGWLLQSHPEWWWKRGEAWRPPEQAALYAKEGVGIAHSKHIYSLAQDYIQTDATGLTPIYQGEFYTALGEKAKEIGLVWGGTFSGAHGPAADYGHVEWPEQPIMHS